MRPPSGGLTYSRSCIFTTSITMAPIEEHRRRVNEARARLAEEEDNLARAELEDAEAERKRLEE